MTDVVLPRPEPFSNEMLGVSPTATGEPLVYGLMGAPFGDQEFDVGKSARWMEYFTDKMFVLDVNLGDPRYWIVNWAITFPDSEHGVTNINFFSRPADFRKEQFRQADKTYRMNDDGWVLWVDASEGLSFDNASLPDDYDFAPFMSFIYREIARAEAASEDTVVLPFFVFLQSAEVQNVTYEHGSNVDDPELGTVTVLQPVSVPYYLSAQGLPRLMKVSVLRDPAFDWTSLDTPVSPSAGVKAQIVSYAYAHWQYFDIPPGETEVPPLDESNDEGWKMRQKISQVRPITGITFDTYPGTEPAGVPGPWAEAILVNTDPDFVPITDSPVTPTDASTAGIRTPLYDCVIRLNMRDGVWYEGGVSGNTPMTWDSVNEKWTTPYDPDTWPAKGVGAGDNPDFVEPPTPV